jgi:hypothetical protein
MPFSNWSICDIPNKEGMVPANYLTLALFRGLILTFITLDDNYK